MNIPKWKVDAIAWAEAHPPLYCICGCGERIKVSWIHKSRGVPITIRGHFRRTQPAPVREWIEANQGKHICKCGCGGVIEIKIHHHVRGIPDCLNGHYSRIHNGMTGAFREKNPHYKGGRYIDHRGYVKVLVFGLRGQQQYELEHRLIMEKQLGRRLRRSEVVHHKNGIKSDNRLENLELLSNSGHSSYHALRGEVGFRLLQKRGITGWGLRKA